jgi:hypothetical protein
LEIQKKKKQIMKIMETIPQLKEVDPAQIHVDAVTFLLEKRVQAISPASPNAHHS